MYHPTTRVLTVLELLQVHQRMSGPALAERLEVDLRTVRRYVTMLQDMGIPIETERGRYGGYRLRGGHRLPPLMFTDDEAFAATIGLLTVRRLGLAVAAPAAESALAKIERVLPPAVRGRISTLQATLVTDFTGRTEMPNTGLVIALSDAIASNRQICITHSSASGAETERTIDPYGIVYVNGLWYLPGHCHLRNDRRTFRVDRIRSITSLESTFEPPAGFDPLAFVQQSLAEMPSLWHIEVFLATTLADARGRIAPFLATLDEVPGGVILRINSEGLEETARKLVGLGVPFLVRAPDELRVVLRALAQELLAVAAAEAAVSA